MCDGVFRDSADELYEHGLTQFKLTTAPPPNMPDAECECNARYGDNPWCPWCHKGDL